MKTRTLKPARISRGFIASLSRALALSTLAALGIGRSDAATLTWDPNQTGGNLDGGFGTWNLVDSNWFDTVLGDVIWPNSTGDVASFGGPTGGAVVINTGTGVSANGLTFNTAGYTLSGNSATDVLTLGGTTPAIITNASATIAASIADVAASGFTKSGTGTLTLSGINTYAGSTSITGGTLSFGAANNLGNGTATNTLNLSGGATLLNTGTSVDLGVNRATSIGTGGGNLSSGSGKTLTVSGALSGAGALGITGGGTFILSADNSGFSGNVNVDSVGGTTNTLLRLTNNNALTGGTVNLAQGAIAGGTGTSLDLAGVTIGSGVTLSMNSNNVSGFRSALTNSSGTSVWNGGVTMNGDGLNQFNATGTMTVNGNVSAGGGGFTGTLFVRGSGTGTINGNINIPAGTLNKTDPGTWTIASPSAPVIAALQVSDGTMKIGATNTFSATQGLTIGQGSGTSGNFDLNGFDQTLSNIAVFAASTGPNNRISNSSGTLSTLTVNNTVAVDYRGSLQGNLKFVADGSAPITLRGTGSTSTGGIQINAGRNVIVNATGASTTVTGTGVTTAVVNNPVGAGAISLAAASVLDLNPLATVSQNGLSGRVFSAAPPNNDSSQVNFTAAATSARWDANLNRYDLTTASGGGTAITPTTNVSAQWLGKLNVAAAGGYRFFGAADDGIRVFIDGALAVNNDGSKGTTDLGGSAINLSAGLHDIRVEYTQGGGGGSAILSWAGATAGLDAPQAATPIPTASLFTAEANATAGSSNAVVIGSGIGDAITVTANSAINLNGTAFTQAQLGGLTNTAGTTLTVNGLAGKTLRFAGTTTVTGSLTLNNTPNVAFDGVLGGTGATIVKQGAGRLIFDQSTAANTIDATSLIDVQGGTAVLLGSSAAGFNNNPIGNAGIQLSGGNLLLDSKGGGATYDNVITATENATIQNIVAGVGPVTTTLGSAARGISVASGKTLTFDAITGGNNLANNPVGSTEAGAQITVAGAITGAGNLNAISTSFGNVVTPGVVVLSNAGNTFGGSIAVNGTTFVGNAPIPVNGPTLRVGAAGALPSAATNAIFVKSGTLDFATNNVAYSPNVANVLTLGGGPAYTTSNINIGTGALTLTNDVVYDATNNGGVATIRGNGAATGILDLNTAGQRIINVGDSSNAAFDMVISAVINATGGGGLTKAGNGTLSLQSNVAAQSTGFTGLTRVSAGTLFVGGGSGFAGDGAIKGNVQIDVGATFKLSQANIIVNSSIFQVDGTLDWNGLQESFGNIAGNGVMTSVLPVLPFLDMPNNAPTFTGSITGQSGVHFGGRLASAPVLIPTSQFAALTYNGTTAIGSSAGVGNGDSPFPVTLQLSSSNALPSGFNRGDVTIQGTAAAGKGTLDLNGFDQILNGLNGASNTVNPIVTNNGLADSTLTVGNANVGGSFGGIIQDGTTNRISLIKTGLGTQTLGGANTFTGNVTVNNGQLTISNAAGLGATSGTTTVNAGGYLNISNVATGEALTLNGRGQPLIQLTSGAGGTLYTGALVGSGGIAGAVTGNITLESNTSIGVVKGSALTIGGIISETTPGTTLTKTQGDNTTGGAPATIGAGGTLVLTGANTYTGATTIQGGELRLANATGLAIQSTQVNIGDGSNGATLTLGASDQMPAGVVLNFGNGSLNTKFQLNGFNQTVGGFQNTRNALPIIQNFEAAGAGTSVLTVNNATDTSFSGLIRNQTGTLALTKAGAGTFTLSGNGMFGTGNIGYTGPTLVTAGKLVFSDSTSTITSPITISGTGSLEFNESFGRTTIYQAALTDGGLGFTKTGLGNLTINTIGNVTGTINVNAGTLNLTDGAGNVNPLAGAPINVAAGAQLQFFGVTAVTTAFNNNVTLNGMSNGGALSGSVVGGSPTNTLSGTLTLASTSNISTGWSDKVFNITGKITGAGGLVIDKLLFTQNPGIINISNTTNDYAGGTTINSGTVAFATGALPATGNLKFGGTFGNAGNFGTGQLVLGTGGLTGFTRSVGTGAGAVQFTGDGGGFSAIGSAQTVSFGNVGPIDWSGTGTTGMDASSSLVINTGTGANNEVNFTNDFNLNGGQRRVMVNTSNSRFTGVLSGTGGLIKDGAGQMFLSGATSNTYTGLTTVPLGILTLAKTGGATAVAGDIQVGSDTATGTRRIVYLNGNEQIADTAFMSFHSRVSNNGDLRLLDFDETLAGILDRSGSGVIQVQEAEAPAANGAVGSVLTINSSADSFYNGFIRDKGTGTDLTVKLSLVKSGTGTLTISQGQQSGGGNQTYSGTTTINGGKLVYANIATFNSAPTIGASGTLEFVENLNQTANYGPTITGAGNLVKSGPGTVNLTAAASDYSGTTTVNNGILNLTNTQAAAHTGAYTVNPGGILLIGNGTNAGLLSNNNAITVNAGGTVAFSRNNGYNYAGVISGAGDVQSRAGGTATILSGANTYSGATTLLQNTTLTLAGNGASAAGLNVNSGSTLTLDFNLAGSNAAGIVAATAPLNLNGGTFAITGSGAANTQTLGPVVLGTALPGGLPGLNPGQTGLGASNINLTSGAGGLNVTLGAISHVTGATANIALPTSGTVITTGTAIGGIANGFTTTSAGTTWLAQDGGGILTPLAAYGADSYGAGINTDVVAGGAGASTNSMRFNTAAATSVTLTGANTIDSGGLLVTSAVAGNASAITGGTLSGTAAAGLNIIQGNSGTFTIGSGIVDNGGATGLTKAGTGTTILNGANTYSGATVVSQGTLITLGTTSGGTATALPGATLQIGDGTTNGILPIFGANLATVNINNSTAQTMSRVFNAASNFDFLANALSNGTTFRTGTVQKFGAGTLTLTSPLITSSFHPRAGTTVIDTGALVNTASFSSIGLTNGDNGILTVKGIGRYTVGSELNVTDLSGSRGTLNIQDQGVVVAANFLVAKTGTSVGVVNQTFGSLSNAGGSIDWRIGGNGTAGADTGAYGIYNLSAGTFQTGRNFQIGASGIGVFNQTGGTVSTTGGTPVVGRFATGGFGLLNLNNGTFTNTIATNILAGENGVGVINVSGAGQLLMTNVGTANIGLAMGGAGGTGTVNLLPGGLIVGGMVRDFDASTATQSNFNFNGGTLRVQTGTLAANAAAFMTGLTAAAVYSGGANIDTNGVATTIAQALVAPAGSGLTAIPVGIAGTGYVGEPIVNITGGGGTGATARAIVSGGAITGFTITNPGTGYTSAPTVTLLGGGATAAGTAGTATFAANATTGGLTKLNTGTLTLNGINTYGGATTIAGGTLALDFATNATVVPATSVLNLNGGSLSLIAKSATNATTTFASTNLNGVGTVTSTITAAGVQSLALGAITRNAGGAADFAPAAGGTITTTTLNSGTTILGGWATHGGGANWAVTSTVAGTNPVTALGSYTANTWAAGNNTDMAAAGTVTNLTTNSVRFNTATPVTVTVSGTDVITTGGILITPTATAAATIFTGGTINSGNATTDLVVNHFGTNNATIISAIGAATGGLVKSGPGALVLQSPTTTNVYTGATNIGAGTLRIGVLEQIPNGSTVNIGAGATLDLNNLTETIGGLTGYGSVSSGIAGTASTLVVGSGNASSTFNGTILNGTGTATTLTKAGSGTLTLNNVTAGTYTGNTNINAGAIKLATPQALANNTIVVVNAANGLLFDTTIPTISALAGAQPIALQTTATSPVPNTAVQLTIGANNNGNNYTGALTGSGTLIKIGTGTQTLGGANTNAGGLVANAGILALSGNNSGAGGSVFVNGGGLLQLNTANSLWGASGRTIVVASNGIVTAQAFTANPTSTGFGAITPLLNRIDSGSTGVLALQTDGSLQTAISENLDFSASGQVSLGSMLTGNGGFGNAPVQYTGVITPNANTFRIGGGGGRLILPNSATMAGANNLFLYGGGNTGGLVYLTGAYGFTGSTTVNAGTTYITTLANAGSGSSIGAGGAAASNLILNGGTLSYIGSGSSTDRLFTLSAAPTALESSGTGPVNFTGTGAVGFLNNASRTFTLQGQNTGANTIAAAFGDSMNVSGTNGTLANGITTLQKNGNGTWFLSGANTFSGGVVINNGVLGFNNAGAIGANSLIGPASVLVNAGGAVALGGSLTTGIQATLNRISPLSTGTVALTANSAESISFDGGSAGAGLASAFLGAYGNVSFSGTLTPFGNTYRLGGGGGTLTIPGGGLTGPRQVIIGGGGPGAGFVNNPNLNGAVVLGGTSDYTGGTILNSGAFLSATSLTALGTGPLKFQGGVYRAVDSTDITVAADGTSAREIRLGTDAANVTGNANVDVLQSVNVTFSKTFGTLTLLGANQGATSFTKFGGGTLVLANGINLNGVNQTAANIAPVNNGTMVIERGTLSILANPTNYAGNIQVGSNNGGVATLKLGADNVFGNTAAQFAAASVVDLYTGSKIDLNGFSDTIRNIRGMGNIVNTGAGSPTLTTGTVSSENMIWGGNLVGSFNLKRVGNISQQFGTGAANNSGIELWNNNNPGFTGKFIADGGGLRFRADGTLGSTSEALVADKITLNNGGILYPAGGNPLVLGANRGITVGSGGGTLWSFGSNSMIVNGPITGPGTLTIADDPGTVYLASNSNTYAGGTVINSNNGARGYLSIGAGGATGSLPAGDVFFNSAAGAARLYLFKSNALTVANNLNGPGFVLQIGAGTTTLTGNNATGQQTFVGGGALRADFTDASKAPIGTGTGLQLGAGTFEYVAPSGDNTLRLGTLTTSFFGMPYNYNGGCFGDAVVQSTYGGSGSQNLIFGGNARPNIASTMNFVTTGGTNGVTNSIRFSAGPAVNNVIGAAFYFNGGDFAANDVNGFVRAANYGADANTAPLNTLITGRYSKLTTSLINQGPVQPAGINLAGPNVNLTFANSGNTTTPFTMTGNPSAILKTGGGGLAGVSVISGGTMAATINPQVTTPATLNTNGQELILRPVTADDYLQIDMPIAGAGTIHKSGLGQLILTGASPFTGQSLINSGSVVVTGNGVLGTTTGGANLRIANSVGASASVTIDSATASIVTGNNANDALRVGEGGAGTFNQSAGTVNAGQYVTLGENLASSGTYNISGGTLNVKNNNANQPQLIVGRAGTGTMNISGNSVVNVNNGAQIQLGVGTVNPGNFGLNLVANAGLSTGVGTINQTGGTVNVATASSYQSAITGGVIIGVDGAGTYNLNGGTLNTPILARGHGTAAFNLGSSAPGVSGTLKATAPTMNASLPINLTGTGADRGTIHTNGNDLTFTGALTGAGGFKKDGAGVLTVLGAGSTYAGGTSIVTGGIVAADTALGTGVVNVGTGTTLNVQGVQTGLLSRWAYAQMTQINPGVTTGSANIATELSSLENYNAFLAGKPIIAVESTAARGKVSVNYLEDGGANGNAALPPAVVALTAQANYVGDLRGRFNAATTGTYTFQGRSDDATAIWVDGQLVVDNNRYQGQVTRTGSVDLTAGSHDIVIAYVQGGGGGGFTVGVTLPGQGQSFQIGSELNMSNDLLSFGSNDLTVGGLAGAGTVNTVAGGTLTDNNAADADFAGVLNGSAAFVKAGLGKQTISGLNGATFSGAVSVTNGTLEVSGSLSGSTVTVSGAGATLSGDGTVGALNVTNGTVAPGNSTIGSLDTANFGLTGGALSIEIGSVSSYDSVNTTGSVTLGGNLVLNIGAGPLLLNDSFTLISNDLSDAVVGTFAGLPEGAMFSAGGFNFTVSYAGGDGNDVTLVVPEPGSAALLLGGLAMLAGRRRRKA